jgi:hypothetical protein
VHGIDHDFKLFKCQQQPCFYNDSYDGGIYFISQADLNEHSQKVHSRLSSSWEVLGNTDQSEAHRRLLDLIVNRPPVYQISPESANGKRSLESHKLSDAKRWKQDRTDTRTITYLVMVANLTKMQILYPLPLECYPREISSIIACLMIIEPHLLVSR